MSVTAPYYDERTETLPRAQIEQLQEARLLQLLPYVYERSALIRSVWQQAGVHPRDIRTLQDFRDKVPFIDKDAIRRFRDTQHDPFGGLNCVGPPHLRGVGFTSGTTGDPTPLPRTEDTPAIAGLKRDIWHIGARPGDHFAYMLFTFREGHNGDRWLDAGFRPIYFQHSPAELPRLLEASERFAPKALMMLSTPLVLALEEMQKNTGIDLKQHFASYRGAVFGGEALSPRLRALAESWDLPLFEFTTLGDVCGAMECSAHDGMHTWEDMVFVENLAPNGSEPVADGERGELVVTSLQDDIAPLVRFRTDDLITFDRGRCTCGRTHGRMKTLGRKGDELLIQGRSVLPRDILPIVQRQPECAAGLFQLVRSQYQADSLRLRIGYNPAATADAGALRARLEALINEGLQVPAAVELIADAELLKLGPPHKIPRVTKA